MGRKRGLPVSLFVLRSTTSYSTARCGSISPLALGRIRLETPVAFKFTLRTLNSIDMILGAENLVKIYKGRRVVNDISVKVEQGEIVGLLGPNGAGKTTSFYMIVGLIKPNSEIGRAHV